MRPQASIGLLWDSVSENMGDEAIGLILQRIFARHQIPASVIHPFKPDLSHIASMVVGGGELIRAPGDPFYDAFRVRGAHILNTVGVVNGTETEYLSEYSLVSTRSEADRAKIGSAGEVCPCITLLYKDYLPPTTLPVDIPDNAIGVHVMPASVPDLIALKDLLTELAPQPIVWLPITHYAHDLRVMQTLANQVPGSVVLPRLSPDECYEAIGRLKLLITSSFHGGLFAYSQGIPFLWRKHYPKLGYFLQDRQRESDLVESSEQLHDMLPQWLNSPPDYSALRAADQARCRGWVDRMMSQADEALRTPPAASFSVPRTDYETYQAKRQLDQLQAEFISGQLADKFAVAERQQIVPQDEPEASEREAAPADAITVPKQKDDVVTEMDQMLVLAAERALAIRRLEKEIRERERQKHDVEEQQYSLMENNAQLREELTALQNTRVVRLAQTYWWPFRRRLQRPRKVAAPTVDSSELVYSLKTRLPGALQIGRGIALPVSGWCYSQRGTFRSLAIMVNDEAHPVVMHSEAQLDVFSSQCPNVDQSGNSLLSGFFAVLDFPEITQQQTVRLSLRAQLENGEIVVQPLGEIQLVPGYGAQPLTVQWRSTSQARVAVCMTTYKPPLDLFTAQIASIKAQTHQNWVCIISDDSSPIGVQNEIRSVIADDDRFIFMAHNERVGVYRNFERCLTYVPADTDFVALSDQDDKWDADKLETLAAAFDAETQLVYADMRVVDRAGKVLSETFWTTRRNNYTDLAALLFANTITGAASMFRASLLAEMLPMPEKVIDEYHDHWLGLTALVKGKIAFINRPLHSYVQHDGNVFGYKQEQSAPGLLGAALIMLRASRNRMKLQATGRMFLGDAVDSYPMVIHKIAWAETLLLRQPNAAASKRNFLKRMSTLRRSLMPLMVESLSAVIRRRPSLRMEQYHLRVALGTRLWNAYFRREKQRLLMSQLQHSQAVTLAAGAPSAPQPASLPNLSKIQALRYGNTDWIAHNISPLTLKPSDR
ncbi:MAG: glycosyltransferase, partial [Anaerolineae bacterium]